MFCKSYQNLLEQFSKQCLKQRFIAFVLYDWLRAGVGGGPAPKISDTTRHYWQNTERLKKCENGHMTSPNLLGHVVSAISRH